MTYKEAIKWFEDNMPEWDYEGKLYCAEPYYLGEYVCTEPEGYAYREAIKALEKQIPKKPTHRVVYFEEIANCPVCGDLLIKNAPYCLSCGQAIDWSE